MFTRIRSVIFFLFVPFLLFSAEIGIPVESFLQKANASYEQAENAATFQERKNSFNEALAAYLAIEKAPSVLSGQLYQAAANTFFQLGEYAWSILYYERALQLEPQNALVTQRLSLAKNKLGLAIPEKNSLFEKLLLQPYFSFQQRLNFFFWIAAAMLSIITTLIWLPSPFLKKLALISGLFFMSAGMNLFITYYFAPLHGIFIQSTGLYRAPSLQQPQLSETPLAMGSKIRIMEIAEQGFWLKVIDLNGNVGYVPASTLRLIDIF